MQYHAVPPFPASEAWAPMLRLVSVQPKVAVKHVLFHCSLSYHTKAASHVESLDWGVLVRCHQRTFNTVGTVFDSKYKLTIVDDWKATAQQGVFNVHALSVEQTSVTGEQTIHRLNRLALKRAGTSFTTPWRRCALSEHSLLMMHDPCKEEEKILHTPRPSRPYWLRKMEIHVTLFNLIITLRVTTIDR
ncbi:hypothetical protein BGW80DRAFT_1307904 [Lactifluus volemus]|nr:hypothetical protein BGW80DRAFT_1307904 [Lactifluus volemus]